MIHLIATGWVVQEPALRVRPSGAHVLTWRIGVRDSAGIEHVIDVASDVQERLDQWQGLLTRGRPLVLHGEMRTRRTDARTAAFGQELYCHALNLEFPDRSQKTPDAADPLGEVVKKVGAS